MELVELSGAEEARLTFRGAAFGLDLPERYGVVDIGGGSTELALGKRDGTVEQIDFRRRWRRPRQRAVLSLPAPLAAASRAWRSK